MIKLLFVLGPLLRGRKSLETKQTQVKPNANRGWPIKPVNHIRPELTRLCPTSSWTTTSQNADGPPPYCGFHCYVESHSYYLANYTLFAYLYVSRSLTSMSTLACDLKIKFNDCPWVQELPNFSTCKSALNWSRFGVNLALSNQGTTLARC